MTNSTSSLAELLADCKARRIRLVLSGDGELELIARRGSLTPDLLARLKAHKAGLLATLRPLADQEAEDPSN